MIRLQPNVEGMGRVSANLVTNILLHGKVVYPERIETTDQRLLPLS